MSEELRFLTIAEAKAALDRGSVSALDLTRAHLSAIAELNPLLGCYLTVDEEAALRTAGSASRDAPLAALPYGVKDNIDTAGLRTTSASRLLMDRVPERDADVVAALSRDGAVLLGKLNTWEFGTGSGAVYPDLAFPIARNPWDRSRFSGGSSTGAGVAVAAGLAMFAIGTDTGGSVRLPAAACGVVGLKPTFGAISRSGMQPNCPSLDHVGILARRVDDVEVVFDTVRATPHRRERRVADARSLRVGIVNRFHEGDVECEPETAQALRRAAETFRDLGAEIVDLDLPYGVLDFRACSRLLNVSECFSMHEEVFDAHRAEIGAALRDKLLAGSQVSSADYLRAVRWRQVLADAVEALFARCDVILCLGAPMVAPSLSDVTRVTRFTTHSAMAVFNISGHPALSMCSGFNRAGLPMNMQLAGRYQGEADLLAAARLYEAATRHVVPPPLSTSDPEARETISPPMPEEASRVAQAKANAEAAARLPRYLPESLLPASTLRLGS